jgi:hypothetical protein
LTIGVLAGLRQEVKEQRPVMVGLKNGLAPVATVPDVINRAAIFEAEFSGHRNEFAPENPTCQLNMRLCGDEMTGSSTAGQNELSGSSATTQEQKTMNWERKLFYVLTPAVMGDPFTHRGAKSAQ